MKHLRTCTKDHGGPGNSATVYGHHGSIRVCIKIRETGKWVYSPGWERKS